MDIHGTRCYVQDEAQWEKILSENFCLKEGEPAGCTIVENGCMLPMRVIPETVATYGDGLFEGGITDGNGFYAGQFRSAKKREFNRSCVRPYDVDESELEVRHETVIFGGILVSHWGHLLVDTTSRLWYPLVHPELDYKIVFLMFPNQSFERKDLLELAGIASSRVEIITQPTRFDCIHVPDETNHSGLGHFRKEWMTFFDAARDNVEPSPHKKVYLTRTAFKISNVLGEDYFENYYREHGFAVFSPEQLTVKEQVALMAGADEVATTIGTISHLALFCKPGTKFTILNRSSNIVREQLAINQARGVNACFVDAHCNFLPEQQGGNCIFLLGPSRHWNAYIADEFGDGPDEAYAKNGFPARVFEYVSTWGDWFKDEKHYRWIRNHTLPSVVGRISDVVNNGPVDVSAFPIPAADQRRIESRALGSLAACKPAKVSTSAEELQASGTITLPIKADDGLSVSAVFCCVKNPLNRWAEMPKAKDLVETGSATCTLSEDHAKLSWEACFNYESLASFLASCEKAPGAIYPCLKLSDGNIDKIMPMFVVNNNCSLTEAGVAASVFAGKHGYALERDKASGLLAMRPSKPAEIFAHFSKHSIESVSWQDDVVTLHGVTHGPLAESGSMTLELLVRAYQPNDENPPEDIVLTCRQSDDSANSAWTVDVDLPALATKLTSGVEAHQRWDLFLQTQDGDDSRHIRLKGGKGAKGFTREPIQLGDTGFVLFPFETDKGNLSFGVSRSDALLSRCWIEELSWQKNALDMSGIVTTHAFELEDLQIWLAVQVRGSKSAPEKLAQLELSKSTQKAHSLDYTLHVPDGAFEAFFEKTHAGKGAFFDLFFVYELNELSGAARIGAKRRAGIWGAFNTVKFVVEGLEIHPHEDAESNLGFRTDSVASKLKKTRLAQSLRKKLR